MSWKSNKKNQASRTPLTYKKVKPGDKPEADPKEVSKLKLSTQNAMPQSVPKADADPSESDIGKAGAEPVADNSREPGANAYRMTNAAVAEVKFPRCDAAVRMWDGSEWDLADAILAECCEPGEDGVRNESYAQIEAMRQEIATNHGIELSFERIRKLRKVASAFPPGRRRPGISLEGHLEAGTPEALDAFISSAPKGTPFTREYIRGQKQPTEKAEQHQQKVERRHQIEDQTAALRDLCRQQERDKEQLLRVKDAREQQYADLCRSVGKEPEPFAPSLASEDETPPTVAEDLEQALQLMLAARGLDPKADYIRQAIADFVNAVLARAQ